jgi:hypothetical protein
MMKTMLTLLFPLIVLGACVPAGPELPFSPPPAAKKIVSASGYPVKALCYIDAGRQNPLNVMDYTLAGAPYFDYVVLGAARIKKDAKGIYLFFPDGLQTVLNRRNRLIVPLQKMGIQVLLGITGGGDNSTFGTMNKDDVEVYIPHLIQQYLNNYRLDGIEFYDTGAGPSVYPPDICTSAAEIREAWLKGGDSTNNVLYFTRKLIGAADARPIIVREENFCRYLPQNVSGSEGEATFSGTAEQINYFINPYPRFVAESVQNNNNPYFLYKEQYCPFLIDLDGSQPVPSVTDPSGQGNDIQTLSERFARSEYGLLYYSGLKAVSQAGFDQAAYLSVTAQVLFGQNVICSGGNRLKDW